MRVMTGLWLGCLLIVSAADASERNAVADRRPEFRVALEAAERGAQARYAKAETVLRDHPLYPWLAYAHLRHDLKTADAARIDAFLQRYADLPVAAALRNDWLQELARRNDGKALLAFYRPQADVALRCRYLQAQADAGVADADWIAAARQLWLTPRSLPAACDPVLARAQALGKIDDALRWERIVAAAEANELGLLRFVARGLPKADSALALDFATFLAAPDSRALQWPRDARSARIVRAGLVQLARRDADAAETLLDSLATPMALSADDLAVLRYQIALWSVASYAPRSAERLARVPDSAYDARLHEWRVREALARGDDVAALAALAALPPAQRMESRWRYIEARLRERGGDAAAAGALYRQAASEANFHGWLAADRLNQPYVLCPLSVAIPAETRKQVAELPGLVRALELFRIDRPGWAAREWQTLLPALDDDARVEAVRLARAAGWHDRAVHFLGRRPDELRHYRLRFPLPYASLIDAQAKLQGLDPSWLAAQIRAESAWMANARSGAHALGLMQLLPTTGKAQARRLGIAWRGERTLLQGASNIRIGSAHLRAMLDRYDGLPYFAIAAYNAGATPVSQWRRERPNLDPDLWIETIPYKETREYVARVLAFSVIYDWRRERRARSLDARLHGVSGNKAPHREFHCPKPEASTAP